MADDFDPHEYLEGFDPTEYLRGKGVDPVVTETPRSVGQSVKEGAGKDIEAVQEGGMEALRGAAATLGEPLKMISKATGIRSPTKQQEGEGTVAGGKVKQKENEELTGPYLAGSMLAGAGAGGAIAKGAGALAKTAPRLAPVLESPMARALSAGGAGGIMQPTPEGPDYWAAKEREALTGMTMGYGFSVGGKVVSGGMTALGEFMSRNYPEVVNSRAVSVVMDRINRGSKYGAPGAKDMIDLVNAANAQGRPMALVDVAGHDVRALGGFLARDPGSRALVRQYLETRDNAAAMRLEGAIAKHVSSGSTMFTTLRGLQQARTEASRPFYQQTDALQGIWSERLQRFIEDPDVRKGLAMGYRLERLDSLANDRPFDPTMLGVDLDELGNIKILRTPNMRVLDMGKQGLDWMIADERDPVTGRLSKLGAKLAAVKDAYVTELDALDKSGVYKKARDTWSGYAGSIDAMKLGNSAFERSPEENEYMISKLSSADKEFALIGLADKWREKLAKAGLHSDESLQILKNNWTKAQVKPFFRSESDYDQFVQAVADENTMARTKNELIRGSQSAERIGEDVTNKTGGMQAAGLAYHVAKGMVHSPFRAWHYLSSAVEAYRLWRDVGIKPTPEMNEALAKILFSETAPETAAARMLLRPPAQPPPTSLARKGAAVQDVAVPMVAGGVAARPEDRPQ